MKPRPIRIGVVAAILAAAAALSPVRAALPALDQKPWLYHFLALEDKNFWFGLDDEAAGKIQVMGKSNKPVSLALAVPVTFIIEEVLPNGRTVTKQILPDSLQTKDAATTKPEKASITGKVTGDASFEAHIEVDHGVVSLGGRLLDPGTLTKNPLRFGVRVTFPSAYRYDSKDDRKAIKAFEKKLKDDRFSITRTDGTKQRLDSSDKLDAESKAINGPGIAEIKVDVSSYQGKVFEFTATQNSKMLLWARNEAPFHSGFSINWYPDPAKDPEGKARLKFDVR